MLGVGIAENMAPPKPKRAFKLSFFRFTLTLAIAISLCVLVYINFHAIKGDVRRGKQGSMPSLLGGHVGNGLLRMLDQSMLTSSDRKLKDRSNDAEAAPSDPSELDESDKFRVATMEKNAYQMREAIDELGYTFRALSSKFGMKSYFEKKLGKSFFLRNSNQNNHKPNQESINRNQQQPQRQTAPGKTDTASFKGKNLTGLNILLLYADDWTHHTLSSFHQTKPLNSILKTPILDALASDGIRFTHNCVTTSVCWISRATLYTGQYMSRHKTTEPCCWNGGTKPKQKLEDPPSNWKELSFYELLAENGYHVGHAGKWGVYLPFDKNVHFNVEEDGWHYRQIGKKMWHITEKNEADALRFLVTRPKDKPFFLNVAFYATHAKDGDKRQYMPQESSMEMYAEDIIPIPPTGTDEAWKKMPYFFDDKNEGRTRWRWRFENYTLHQSMMKNYYRMATEVDAACGAILEELRRQDVLNNTVVIFTTDNGNFHSEHGLADKWYPHQESIRVPLIIRDPRMAENQRGTTNDEFTLNIDLSPTILGAAGIPVPEKMMGRDISHLYLTHPNGPVINGEKKVKSGWRQEFFYEHPIISHKKYIPSSEALVRKDYKYMYWPDYDFEQFFDLVRDPGELEDVINSTKPEIIEIRKEMKKRFNELKLLVKSDAIITL